MGWGPGRLCLTRPSQNPVLPFLEFLVFTKENLEITKDFLSLPNPQNPWKRQRKHQINQGISMLKIYQGNPKKKTKERKDREFSKKSYSRI